MHKKTPHRAYNSFIQHIRDIQNSNKKKIEKEREEMLPYGLNSTLFQSNECVLQLRDLFDNQLIFLCTIGCSYKLQMLQYTNKC